ncbi:matrixin family metalloprotease [Mycobacteroides abscessus subsp. abscessus]|jgi:hypothetical protein|uniref:matrixin family metalloprotease n=1 Tax=Mycobacteroides abscessus TaxID=36809 RepID=UPI00266BF243|nr:matrixin family metalloprotease [Mycobacteroides abscessus]MDO3013278.1 matrixin family metalloprotease [Mycobacteroides abscessus subsp. abscessus]
MNHRSWLDISGRPRRWSAAVAVGALIAAGVVVTLSDRGVWGPVAIPRAEAQPAPTGATGGGSGGGFGAPPFPLQPPGMPDGPGGYSNGYYPAPDQSWGINIYETGPQAPAGSQGGYYQAPNYPQQQLQPANGTQPPDYDAPLQPQPNQTVPRASSLPQRQQPAEQPSQPAQQQAPQQHSPQPVTQQPSPEPSQQPVTPQSSAPAQPGQGNNGSSNNGQQNSDNAKDEGDDDRSDKCPGNVSPLYANDNVDSAETKPMTVKDPSPFIADKGMGQVRSRWGGKTELTFHVADGTPDVYAKAFREAAKRWNAAQNKVDVHEVGPTAWYDIYGPDVTFKVADADPPKGANGGPIAGRAEGDAITLFSQTVAPPKDPKGVEQLTGVLGHEIGHALGLDHSCKGAIMYYRMGGFMATTPTPLDVAILNGISR